ncbi:MAG: hypothetical protein U1E85_06625 [Rhodocyclaceae bacterium]
MRGQFLMPVLVAMGLLAATSVAADGKGAVTHYQTLPGSTIRDYGAPAFVTKGGVTYQTLPGSTIRDYQAPAFVTQGGVTYQTLPGSSIRDYRQPAYIHRQGR